MFYQPRIDFTPEEVLVYLRKSRTDDPTLSVEEVLEKHEIMLDEWAEKFLGGKVPDKNKFREVVSGETIKDRPEFQNVLRLIESPKYKATLTVDVERISRGDLEDAGRLIKLYRYSNTLAITLVKAFDIRDEYDREAFERELKRGSQYLEYTKKIMNNGRLLSVSQGNFIGNIAPYGYDKVSYFEGKRKCHTLKIDEAEADVVRMIFDMYVNQDLGRVTIAHQLNSLGIPTRKGKLWAQDTIKGILENEHYIGKVRWNWRKTVTTIDDGEVVRARPKHKVGEYLLYDGKHPAIISEELFAAARKKQGRNHRAKPTTKVRNPLAGLLFCQCGRAMSLRTYKKDGKERSAPRLLCDNQAYCKTTSCLYDEIIELVCDSLERCVADFEVKIKNNNLDAHLQHQKLIKRLETKLIELEKKEENQWEKYTEEGMPKTVFDSLNAKVLKQKEETQHALCEAKRVVPEPIDYEEKLYRFKTALDALKDPDVSALKKNAYLKECIERIDYKRGKAERLKSQQVRYYDPEQKKTVSKSNLKIGANWSAAPIELDIKLRR